MVNKREIPEWVLKHKEKNTEILKRRDCYYLSKISNKWDPVTKKSKKITEEYLGKITPNGLIPPKHKNNITNLDKNSKLLRDIQILSELELGKEKSKIAKQHSVTTKTITNVKERFKKNGVKGLIHRRETETVKVSSKEELKIVTELLDNPEKDSKEIKKKLEIKTSIKKIDSLIMPIKEHLKLKKKLLLAIEIE